MNSYDEHSAWLATHECCPQIIELDARGVHHHTDLPADGLGGEVGLELGTDDTGVAVRAGDLRRGHDGRGGGQRFEECITLAE